MLFLAPALLTANAWSAPVWPEVTAKSAFVMDYASGKVLWTKAPDTPRYPASTTKVLTALLLLESRELDDVVVAPPGIDKVTGSSMHLLPGEVLSVKDALYAMLLRSANDVCEAVALELSGSIPTFVNQMNARAKELGATRSNFNNPHGLNDPLHTTTARDLAIIARAAMNNETFREVVRTKKYTISRNLNTLDRQITTRDTYLERDPTADGIKTGFTSDAGHCFVGTAVRNGFRVITVILDSKDWHRDQATLLNWSYHNYAVAFKGRPNLAVPIENGSKRLLSAQPKEETQLLNRNGAGLTTVATPLIHAPVVVGQAIGNIILRDNDGVEHSIELVSTESIAARSNLVPLKSAVMTLGGLGTMFLCSVIFKKRRLRR